ncbi:SH3 domain-containing protein [Aquimarina aquimarini]|uniref:SH3 domain-containing protein n=1 Tax=Aquimarina aquimarini TaxID=1191734 RepID=UPI000D55C188|nr:SH3 domain-containing protein [Aquimarina aquimarini]
MKFKNLTTIILLITTLNLSSQDCIITAKSGLNVRKEPSLKSKKIGKLDYKQKATIIERTLEPLKLNEDGKIIEGFWVKIKTDKLSGYVFKEYLEITQDLEYDYFNETFDSWLKLGLTQKEVIKRIGVPSKKGEDQEWSAIPAYIQEWKYDNGITLHMESESADSKKTVFMITISEPCNYKNSKKIGINSSITDVLKSYTKYIDDLSFSENQIIAGSIYGGVIFGFENGKVSSIFIGAAAE